MILETFNNIENIYENIEIRKKKIKKEYKDYMKLWKQNYPMLVKALNIFTDKMIEWENENEEMKNIYKELIKKLRKHMKKLETM